jgi:hypothetical protein
MKHEICPECGKAWNENEIEFQLCDKCGFEDTSSAVIARFKKWGVISIFLILVIAITVGFFLLLVLYLNVPSGMAKILSLCVLIGGYFIVVRSLRTKKT